MKGCDCPTHWPNGRRIAKNERCTDKWIRCNGALAVWQAARLKTAKALVRELAPSAACGRGGAP